MCYFLFSIFAAVFMMFSTELLFTVLSLQAHLWIVTWRQWNSVIYIFTYFTVNHTYYDIALELQHAQQFTQSSSYYSSSMNTYCQTSGSSLRHCRCSTSVSPAQSCEWNPWPVDCQPACLHHPKNSVIINFMQNDVVWFCISRKITQLYCLQIFTSDQY